MGVVEMTKCRAWAGTALRAVAGEPIGRRVNGEPIWPVAGADGAITVTGGDDEGDDDADDDDDEGEEGDDDPGDTYTPPTRDEYERTLAALKAAQTEAQTRRKYLRAAGINHRTGKPLIPASTGTGRQQQASPDDEGDDEGAASAPSAADLEKRVKIAERRATERAAAAAELHYKPALAKVAAEAALAKAGWSGKDMGRVLKLIDLEEVDIDPDTHEVIGITEQVEQIRVEFPEWFRRGKAAEGTGEQGTQRPRRTGASSVDGAQRPARQATQQPKGWIAMINDKIERGR